MSEWDESTIDQIKADTPNAIAMGPFGSRIKTDNFVSVGVPVIRGKNLNAERLFDDDFVYLTEEKADELRASNAFPGDIVITHRGTLGQVGIVPYNANYPRYVVSQSQMKLTVNKQKADPFFVFYFLRSPQGQHALLSNTSQTGVPAIAQPTTSLKAINIPLPPLPEQRAIAHILGTLDDKIELNRRMNETLEAMARAIFKSWFVDFDPVSAKAEGLDTGLPEEIADLFPDSFEDSELGEVPKGWNVRTIGDLAEVVGGSTPSTKEPAYWDGGIHYWATPKDLSSLSTPVLLNTERLITDVGLSQISSGLFPKGTILLSSRAPIGYLAVAEVPVAINQGFIAMKPKKDVSNLFILLWASFAHEDILSRANGSTFLEISKSNFRPIPVITPIVDVMNSFDKWVSPLYDKLVECEIESRTLAELRDTLLPKLISGELRVKEVEHLIRRTD